MAEQMCSEGFMVAWFVVWWNVSSILGL